MSVLLKVEMVADFAIDLDHYVKLEEDRIAVDIQLAAEIGEPAQNILKLVQRLEHAQITRRRLLDKIERAYDDHAEFVKTLNEMAGNKS